MFPRSLPAVVLLLSFVGLPAQKTSSAASKRINIDASANLITYLNASSNVIRANTPKGQKQSTMLDIPTVDIYSPDGILVYHGGGDHKAEYIHILEGLPASAADLHPITDRPPLKPLLDVLPETQVSASSMAGDRHYVVYAVTLEEDHVTSTQAAIAALRERSPNIPVDTILVRLKR